MFKSTKIIELGSCAFRQPQASSHCRFLHGYRLTAKFWFETDKLDHKNWVVDFGGLKGLKQLLRNQFDHTTCISKEDPKMSLFKQLSDEGVCDLRIMDGVGIEKFAEYCYTVANEYVHELTDGRCRCSEVEVFEHEDNSAMFRAPRREDGLTFEEWRTKNDIDKVKLEVKPTNKQKDVTRPPFAGKQGAPVGNKKQSNTWIDKGANKNTFGL